MYNGDMAEIAKRFNNSININKTTFILYDKVIDIGLNIDVNIGLDINNQNHFIYICDFM